jgi:hypothetical protein
VRRLLTSMQRKGGERTRAKMAGKRVLIWSGEHGCYWRPDRCGYTRRTDDAGIYEFHDAWAATSHCGPEKRIAFVVVAPQPASDRVPALEAEVARLREALEDVAEHLAISLDRLGCCGEGDGKDRKADNDSWGGVSALNRAKEALNDR